MNFNEITLRMMHELDFRLCCMISCDVLIGSPATCGEFIADELHYEEYG